MMPSDCHVGWNESDLEPAKHDIKTGNIPTFMLSQADWRAEISREKRPQDMNLFKLCKTESAEKIQDEDNCKDSCNSVSKHLHLQSEKDGDQESYINFFQESCAVSELSALKIVAESAKCAIRRSASVHVTQANEIEGNRQSENCFVEKTRTVSLDWYFSEKLSNVHSCLSPHGKVCLCIDENQNISPETDLGKSIPECSSLDSADRKTRHPCVRVKCDQKSDFNTNAENVISQTHSECSFEHHIGGNFNGQIQLEHAQPGQTIEPQSSTSDLQGQAQSLFALGPYSDEDVDSLPSSEFASAHSGLAVESQENEGMSPVVSSVHLDQIDLNQANTEKGIFPFEKQQSDLCKEEQTNSVIVAQDVSSISINDMPDELLLKFFAFFSPPELCRHITAVCRWWHRLAYDSSLWHKLDLSSWRVNGCNLRQIVLHVPGAIRYLDMSGMDNLTEQDMIIVAQNCPNLTHLDVGFVDDLNSVMVQAVLTSCQKLQFFNVEGCRNANNEMMRVLAASAGPLLKQLNFSHCALVDESLKLMMKHISGITHLNIDGISWISEQVVRHLAWQYSDTLESLELDGNELTDYTMYFISFCLKLKTLSISFCENLTDQTLRHVLCLDRLEKLVLRKGLSLSTEILTEFFSASSLQHLKYLDLTECQQLDDQGVQAIAKTCGHNLQILCLSWCWDITDEGMEAIAGKCPHMVKIYLVGLHRLEGAWLPTAVEKMTKLIYISFEQCNEVTDSVIEEAVRGKHDLIILNYYGEVFLHNSNA